MPGSERQVCPGCRVQLPGTAGPTHPYLLSSPSCWDRYGELLAAQYPSPPRMAFHQLVVDAYAVQHPGGDDPRAVQSVGIHLMTLCLFVEDGVDPSLGTTLHKRMVERPVFQWLPPPRGAGLLTVLDVPVDGDPAVARQQALLWAASAWRAWQVHYDTVRRWLSDSGLGQPTLTQPRPR